MGNREDLLSGAQKCLIEKGYVQTTDRDIANASGVSLAAIGYHFGTKEALLQEAMVQANTEWGQRVSEAAAITEATEDTGWGDWFEHVWAGIISASEDDQRLLQASIEVLLNVNQSTHVYTSIENGMLQARQSFLDAFEHKSQEADDRQANAIGAFYHALMIGVRLLRLATPDHAPGAHELCLAMRAISDKFCEENRHRR